MKSKYLVWFLMICLLVATSALGQDRKAGTVGKQKPDNLAQDVILVPVEAAVLTHVSAEVGEPFSISPSFAANVTAQQQAVFQQAINEWTAIIRTTGVTPGNYPVAFSNGPLTGGLLALTTTTFNSRSGDLISASIVFENGPGTTWYVDPNPADDVEFNGAPPAGSDLLTVARHELGHALGWSDTKRVTDYLSGNVFDPTHLNIATALGVGRHTDPNIHTGDIMNPSLGPSIRRPISLYPAAAMVARAFLYDITMNFASSTYTGDETGSANEPWNTVREGADLAPFGQLLLIPGTYAETVPLTLSRPMTISVARGGRAIIGKQP